MRVAGLSIELMPNCSPLNSSVYRGPMAPYLQPRHHRRVQTATKQWRANRHHPPRDLVVLAGRRHQVVDPVTCAIMMHARQFTTH
jgi:hypothetical protein